MYTGNIVVFKPFLVTPTVIYVKLGGANFRFSFRHAHACGVKVRRSFACQSASALHDTPAPPHTQGICVTFSFFLRRLRAHPPHTRGIILLYLCADIYMLICCSPYSQNAPISHYQIRFFVASKRIRILLTNCIWSVSGPQLIRTEHSDCSAAMPIAVST